jgi:hypothetical protein
MVVKSRSAGTSRSAEEKDEWVYVDGQWYWQSYAEFEADEPRWFANQDSSESSGDASGASVAAWRADSLIGFSVGETNGVMYRHLIEEGFAFETGVGWSIIGEDALQVHATFLRIGDSLYVGVGARVKFEDDTHFGLRFPLGLQTEDRWPQKFLEAAPLVDLDPHFAVHLSVTAGLRW